MTQIASQFRATLSLGRMAGRSRQALFAAAVLAAGLSLYPLPAWAAQAICIARVAADGTLLAFGGKGTKSVTPVRNGTGSYTVTCNGKYSSAGSLGKLIINSTAESAIFGVSNAYAVSYSNTAVEVQVFTWPSDTTTETDNVFFVTIFLGK